MKIHASGEDYLEAVLVLQKKLGMVRSVDVARYMEVSKPSVCYAVGTLREGGFLTMDEKHYLHLTELGRDMAEKIYERHCFFTHQLICRYLSGPDLLLPDPAVRLLPCRPGYPYAGRIRQGYQPETCYQVYAAAIPVLHRKKAVRLLP